MNKSKNDIVTDQLAFWDVLANNIRQAIENGAEIPDLRIIIQPEKRNK